LVVVTDTVGTGRCGRAGSLQAASELIRTTVAAVATA
jgi:hypothetical protein